MRPTWRGVVAAVVLAVLLGPASPRWIGSPSSLLSAQTPSRPEVVSLEFEGNEAFSDRQISNRIVTRETNCRNNALRPFCWLGMDFALDRSYLSPATFGDDFVRVFRLYWGAGFRAVQVDTTVTRHPDNTAEIVFGIVEGEPHRIVSLELRGLEDLRDPTVLRDLPIAVGDRLDFEHLEATRDSLENRLRNSGYARAEVFRNLFIPAGTREAEVEFDVYTGALARFGEISIEGNVGVADAVILRSLPFEEGTTYSETLRFEAQRNLYSQEIFTHAAIEEISDAPSEAVVPVRVTVNEGDGHRVRAGGGWDTAECFHAESRWSSLNFFGGLRRLVLRGRASNLFTEDLESSLCSGAGSGAFGELNWVISADFTQPFIFSPKNSFAASVYAERQSLQDVFVRRAVGLNLSLARSIGRASFLTLSVRPQLARLDAAEIFFCTSFLVCDPEDIDLLQATNVLSPIGLSLTRDRTNRVFSPTGGYTLLVDLEHASELLGSDFRYDRVLAETTAFYGITENLVLAGRIRGGWLGAKAFRGLEGDTPGSGRLVAHPQKRFYAGGSNSVRGFAENRLGPQVVSTQIENLLFPVDAGEEAACTPEEVVALSCDASGLTPGRFFARPTGGSRLLEGSIELRFPLIGATLGGAAFVDFGRVHDGTAQFSLSDVVFTPGFGLRYTTPIGPIRVDVAYNRPESAALQVVSSQIRPYDPEVDSEDARLRSGDRTIEWVRLEDLALLGPRVTLDDGDSGFWDLDRFQLHISIGQAF